MKYILVTLSLLTLFSFNKCNFKNNSGGGMGGIPTADDLDDYIQKMTTPENKSCDDITLDDQPPGRKIKITASGHTWEDSYNDYIDQQFDKSYMSAIRQNQINSDDLDALNCPGYNYANHEEKKRFWKVFLSATAKPESDFDARNSTHDYDGTYSTGLLQIDSASANRWCPHLLKELKKTEFTTEDMKDPKMNLQCGLIMMQSQLIGVPLYDNNKNVYSARKDTIGRLFTERSWYWAVLNRNHSKGLHHKVIHWFKKHSWQLPFCSRISPLTGQKIENKKLDFSKQEIYDTNNPNPEERETDPRFGENRNLDTCANNVDQSSINNQKPIINKTINVPEESGNTKSK